VLLRNELYYFIHPRKRIPQLPKVTSLAVRHTSLRSYFTRLKAYFTSDLPELPVFSVFSRKKRLLHPISGKIRFVCLQKSSIVYNVLYLPIAMAGSRKIDPRRQNSAEILPPAGSLQAIKGDCHVTF